MKTLFVPTSNGMKNVSMATSIIYEDGFTLALDSKCNVVCFDKSDNAKELFQRLKKIVKPTSNFSLLLENGSFIYPSVISEIFISPKSGNLLIIGINKKLLHMFKSSEFNHLDDLLTALSERLSSLSESKSITEVNWSDFK